MIFSCSILSLFDSVVMLTWSNWHTELRSNRYHYATRFAKHVPVVFVQPDLEEAGFHYEGTDVDGVIILHIYKIYGKTQSQILREALTSQYYIKPLFWIYNFLFVNFVTQSYSPLKIFHATEDYFTKQFENINNSLVKLLDKVDLLVSVSEGVKNSYIKNSRYSSHHIILTNGCDFNFWKPKFDREKNCFSCETAVLNKKIAFYQGNIFGKIDAELLYSLMSDLCDWEFWFCGPILEGIDRNWDSQWQLISKLNNFKYFGSLPIEEVRELAYQATVGLIPFTDSDLIIERSFPLKAFEYIASGLPVVSVPIKALMPFSEVIDFARSPKEFADSMEQIAASRYDQEAIKLRLDVAKHKDYDKHFELLQSEIENVLQARTPNVSPLYVLVLYDNQSIHINTIREHLASFIRFSCHCIDYVSATGFADVVSSFDRYDVIVIHYCIRVNVENHLSPNYSQALKAFGGYKILYIQDEYDTTETARIWIENIGIHAIFTCVPDQYVNDIYPKTRFPNVEFIQTLTGFVPERFERLNYLQINESVKPIADRKLLIVYRGRRLPYWYGDLGQEKFEIGIKVKQICETRSISADIECDDSKRIYGEGWYEFLGSGKATLGSESGSNVFDDFGDIRANIEAALKKNPAMTYAEARNSFLRGHEAKIRMNQVSPKMFEAIALKTALILFEGEYSGILKPDLHYISLKKDFSNIDEVLDKLQDNQYLEELVERAYQDIVSSGQYSYQKFINNFDKFLTERLAFRRKTPDFISNEYLKELEERQQFSSLKLRLIFAIKNPRLWIGKAISIRQFVQLKLQAYWFKLKATIKKLLKRIEYKRLT